MLNNVTFAIPTYNRNEYLKKLMDSIPQNLGFSFAISDNGGYVMDDILQNHITNVRIVSSKEIIPMYSNWNKAIALVETKWFLIPSDDDLYYAENFQYLDSVLNKHADADIIIFGHHVIDENDKVLSTWLPVANEFEAPSGFNNVKYGVDARFPSILFKTDFVKKIGEIDTTYDFTAGDSLFIQKCLIHGRSIFVDQVIGAYRTWPNNFTNQRIASKEWLGKIDRWQDEIANELEKNGISYQDIKNIKDEVYAQNLLNGILVMKKNRKSLKSVLKFVFSNRFPWKANLKTNARILKQMFAG